MKYPWDKCEYAATTASHLMRHIESKHEGVRYPCGKCEYSVFTAGVLSKHDESKHKGVML